MSIEREAPEVVKDVEVLKKAAWDKFSSESVIFGLAQALNDTLQGSQLSDEEKGSVLSLIVNNLCDENKQQLSLYYELRNAIFESKQSVIH